MHGNKIVRNNAMMISTNQFSIAIPAIKDEQFVPP